MNCFLRKTEKNPFSRFLHKNYGFLYHLSGKPRFMEVDSIVNYVYFVYFRIMMSKEWSSVQVQIPITTRHLPHEQANQLRSRKNQDIAVLIMQKSNVQTSMKLAVLMAKSSRINRTIFTSHLICKSSILYKVPQLALQRQLIFKLLWNS